MEYSGRLCVLNPAELSTKYFVILFMCASSSEWGRDRFVPGEKARKQASHLHYI